MLQSCVIAPRHTALSMDTLSEQEFLTTILRCNILLANCFCWRVSAGAPDSATMRECCLVLPVRPQGPPEVDDSISDCTARRKVARLDSGGASRLPPGSRSGARHAMLGSDEQA